MYQISDPDLGWHLKYGEYLVQNWKILKENTFSTEMTNYVWTNISWGIDILTYLIYKNSGFWGLSIAGAVVSGLTFFVFSKAFDLGNWEKALIFPFLFLLSQSVIATSFRGQNLSLLLLGSLYLLLNKYSSNKKTIFYIPILFLFWANLHGLFVLGLAVLLLWEMFFLLNQYITLKTIKHKDIVNFAFINIISFFLTLFHPYGFSIYKDSLSYIGDPLLKNIAEYVPFESLSLSWYGLFFATIIALVGVIVILYKKEFQKNIINLGIFAVLYVMSLGVKRFVWPTYFFLIPILKPIAGFIKPDKAKNAEKGAALLFFIYILIAIYFKYPFTKYLNMDWAIYCKQFNSCSDEGAQNLSKYYVHGKTMTYYSWGGWLIWNYPELKPSIDGRMHLWRDQNGVSAFADYYQIEQGLKNINASQYDVVFMYRDKPVYENLNKLAEQDVWEKKFEDNTSGIFVRK